MVVGVARWFGVCYLQNFVFWWLVCWFDISGLSGYLLFCGVFGWLVIVRGGGRGFGLLWFVF